METRIGRTSDNDVVLFDPGVSRKHVRVFEQDGKVFAEDLGSANGTKVNGTIIKGAVALNTGDTITLGPVVFAFEHLSPPEHQVAGQQTRIVNRQTVLPSDRKITDAEMQAAVNQPTRGMQARELRAELERMKAQKAAAQEEPAERNEVRRAPAAAVAAAEDDDEDSDGITATRRPKPPSKRSADAPVRSPLSGASPSGDGRLSASERARIKRQAGDSLGGQIQYGFEQMPKKTQRILLGLAALVILGTLGGLYVVFAPKDGGGGPDHDEPSRLTMAINTDSYGLGPDVMWIRPDMKVFDFEFTTPTRAVVVLHYQAQDISENEVAVILNGVEQAPVPPDVSGAVEREIEQVLQVASLKRNERNQVIFDNVKNPPGEEPWKITGPWIEVVPIPEISSDETIRSAQEYATKANQYNERRTIGSENLFLAWKNYRYAWIAMESLDEKPELYATVRYNMAALKKELDQLCGRLMLDAQKSIQLKNRKKARQTLEEVPRYFPTSEHRCHNLRLQKMNEYEL